MPKKLATEAKAGEDKVVRSLMTGTTARAAADSYAHDSESRGLGRLDDGVELSKHPFTHFRIPNESARGTVAGESLNPTNRSTKTPF